MKLFSEILFGGDYNPDQWLDRPDILRRDVELMREANINTVTLGVFSWAALEPSEGTFTFSWLEDVIGNLYDNGIRTILATPSGARPRWLAAKYPEVLRVNADRTRNLFGERHNHCCTSPAYREKVHAIDVRLAEAFADNPAVILWHISNELGGECHCDLCQDAFRKWLKERYETIDEINHAWWTAFWSHQYTSFEQIESPSPSGDMGVHGLNLAWKRFNTDQTADFLKHEIAALREGGAEQPTTTNFMADYTGLDYSVLAREIDYVSWDSYPFWHCADDYQTAVEAEMQHDFMRCLKNKPFLMMESSPSSVNWHEVSRLKRPGIVMNACLQAVAHGADSAQFFQIRQGRGNSEKFHGAVIDHYGGEDTRVFREVSMTGAVLKGLSEVTRAEVKAPAAVVISMESRWAMEDAQGPRNAGLGYMAHVLKVYRALRECGINVDVLDASHSFESYRILAVPMLYMFRKDTATRLQAYTEAGGTLVMTCWSGVVNEDDLCWLGGTPHDLTDVLGLRFEEIDALPDGAHNHFFPADGAPSGLDRAYFCGRLCELVALSTAKPLMVYGDDFYSGYPAVTVNSYGKGNAWYVAADAEQKLFSDLMRHISRRLGIQPILEGAQKDVLLSLRSAKDAEYIFAQNFSSDQRRIVLPESAEVLHGQTNGVMPPYSSVVLRTEKA